MSTALKDILLLKEIRLRREERLQQERRVQAAQCERAEQAYQAQSQRAQETMAVIQQRKYERWSELSSSGFDSRMVMQAYDQDNDDAYHVLIMEQDLNELKEKVADSQDALAQAVALYTRCVRKLETCKELVSWHGRQLSKRDALRDEMLADERQGARHGRG